MQVFKNYFKIAKSFLPMILMYLLIFLFFAIIATSQSSSESGAFSAIKPPVAIENHDNSIFSNGFVDYIKQNTEVVDVEDNETAQKEAIYFQKVLYVYVIPENFGNDLFASKEPKITTLQVFSSYAEQARMLGENYLRLSSPRIAAGMSQTDVVAGVKNDISNGQTITEVRGAKVTDSSSKVQYFYNFASYVMLALCIMIVSMIMIIFASKNIKRRNLVSSLSYGKITGQLLFGNLILAVGIWLMFVITSCFLYPDTMLTTFGIFYALNAFTFTIVALSISFLIGSLSKNKNVANAMTNIIALGSSFICGVFMPQSLLGDSVLNFAKFLPTYWYVKSNELIYGLSDFSFESLKPILGNMAIVLGFAGAIFIATYIIGRFKRKD
jgi:ABC-2 type transport system permease protein